MRHFIRMPHILAGLSQGQPIYCAAVHLGLFMPYRHAASLLPTSSEVPAIGFLRLHVTYQSQFKGSPPWRLLFAQHGQDGRGIRLQTQARY